MFIGFVLLMVYIRFTVSLCFQKINLLVAKDVIQLL